MDISNEKGELLKMVADMSDDIAIFDSLGHVSGVTVEHLKAVALSVQSKADQIEEMFGLLTVELSIMEREAVRNAIALARRKACSFMRTVAVIPTAVVPAKVESMGRRKLQKLALPIFDGDIREWRTWWPAFETAVKEMVPMDKLQYLASALKGPPLELIRGYSLAPENFEVIVASLDARYNNTDLLAQAYQKDLEDIPVSGRSWAEQQSTLDGIKRIVVNLKSIGVAVDEGNARALIIQRFPESTILAAFYEAMFLQLCQDKNFEALTSSMESLRLPLDLFLEAVGRALLKLQFIAQAKGDNAANTSTATTLMTGTGASSSRSCGTSGNCSSHEGSGGGNVSHGRNGNNKKRKRPASERKEKTEDFKCIFCGKSSHKSIDCRDYMTLQRRKQRLTEQHRCFVCFKTGHLALACKSRKSCSVCQSGMHHPAICRQKLDAPKKTGHKERKVDTQPVPSTSGGKTSKGTFLQTFLCRVSSLNNKGICVARGVLDCGSTISYISNDLVWRLRTPMGPLRTLGVQTFATEGTTSVSVQDVTLFLMNSNGNKREVSFVATNNIVGRFQLTPPPEVVVSMLPSDKQYADSDVFCRNQRQIEILLGSDVYYDFVKINGNLRLDNGIVLLRTFFGWLPAGRGNLLSSMNDSWRHQAVMAVTNSSTARRRVDSEECVEDKELSSKLESLWALEALGIKSSELADRSEEILQAFYDTRRIENGRYIVRWPRRKENINLPTNYRMCVARLRGTLERTPVRTLQECHKLFLEQEKSEIIERAPYSMRHLTHYLPHRPVCKGDKLRIVYDASAKTKTGISLNDVLYAGPSLIKDIVGLMIGFRMKPVAVLADIEKAFHQVGLDVADRDMVRFLWVKDPLKPMDTSSLIVYRFCRVPFGVISSPFLLNIVLNELFAKALQTAVGLEAKWYALGQKSFYVDNLIISVDNVVEAVNLYQVLSQSLHNVGFNLRDWASNIAEFTNTLSADKAASFSDPISVHGMNWDRKKDTLSLRFDEGKMADMVTKRKALATYAEVYDPMGIVAPCTLSLKLFVQDCWLAGFSWDAALPAILETRFRKLVKERDDCRSLNFPRRLWSSTDKECMFSLHIFTDASKKAYGCVHYLVKTNKRTELSESALLFSKVRLAPRKLRPVDQLNEKPVTLSSKKSRNMSTSFNDVERSIPQLELLGATLGARSAQFILAQLRERDIAVAGTYLWTDATTVLQWLHTPTVLPLFVENRVREIKSIANLTVRYVHTKSNPADFLTHGKLAAELREEKMWWYGPDWLICPRLWPESPFTAPAYVTATTLLTSLVIGLSISRPCVRKVREQIRGPSLLSDKIESHYSIWNSYVRLFSIFRQKILKHRIQHLSATEEFRHAEIALLRAIQLKYFPVELAQLEHKIQPKNSLDLFLDSDNLIRCGGRLLHANLPFDAIHPILLPRNSKLTDVLLFSLHNRNRHVGAAHLLAIFRERFWVVKGRVKANSVVRRCAICRRLRGSTYVTPSMPSLPLVRVADVAPFIHTGLDYFGPYYMRQYASEQQVSYKKMYGVLFTCLVTCAVHLEIAEDLSGDQFLLAFIRFISRRGTPRFILSDNGTNFRFVQPLISGKVKLNHYHLESHMAENNIEWCFIPTLSPWYGGVYERLVGVVKQSLHKALRHYTADHSELTTAFCQTESIVNSRPLTYISSEDTLQALTPSHFLRLRKGPVNDDLILDLDTLPEDTEALLHSYRRAMSIVETFRTVFHSLYLSALRQTHDPHHRSKQGSANFIAQPGTVVLLQDPYTPRSRWPMGVIESVDKQKAQAQVRIVHLEYSKRLKMDVKSTFPTQVVSRPVRRLVPFEMPSPSLVSGGNNKESLEDPSTTVMDAVVADAAETSSYTPPLKLRRLSGNSWQILSRRGECQN